MFIEFNYKLVNLNTVVYIEQIVTRIALYFVDNDTYIYEEYQDEGLAQLRMAQLKDLLLKDLLLSKPYHLPVSNIVRHDLCRVPESTL